MCVESRINMTIQRTDHRQIQETLTEKPDPPVADFQRPMCNDILLALQQNTLSVEAQRWQKQTEN